MTTPAPAPTADDMIGATFRALAVLAPGAAQSPPETRPADTLAILAHHGADPADLDVIRTWLAGRPQAALPGKEQ